MKMFGRIEQWLNKFTGLFSERVAIHLFTFYCILRDIGIVTRKLTVLNERKKV